MVLVIFSAFCEYSCRSNGVDGHIEGQEQGGLAGVIIARPCSKPYPAGISGLFKVISDRPN